LSTSFEGSDRKPEEIILDIFPLIDDTIEESDNLLRYQKIVEAKPPSNSSKELRRISVLNRVIKADIAG
jgi:hypothetical protein